MSYRDLAMAIAASAFSDYKTLKIFLKAHPDNKTTKRNLKKLKNFIFSDRFAAITDIDVPYMIKKIDEFVEEGGKKCISVGLS